MSNHLKSQRERVESLKQEVAELHKKATERRRQFEEKRAKEQAAFWLGKTVIPYLEGVAERFGEPLEDGVRRLIREQKNPFRVKGEWNRRAEAKANMQRFFSTPQTCVLLTMAGRFLSKYNPETIRERAEWVLDNVMKEYYPFLYDAVVTESGGKEWFISLVEDLVKTVKTNV